MNERRERLARLTWNRPVWACRCNAILCHRFSVFSAVSRLRHSETHHTNMLDIYLTGMYLQGFR